VIAANAAADAVASQGGSASAAIQAGNDAFVSVESVARPKTIEGEAQLGAAAASVASADRLQRLGADVPEVVAYANSAAASASAQVGTWGLLCWVFCKRGVCF
jgi:hypothetical protein